MTNSVCNRQNVSDDAYDTPYIESRGRRTTWKRCILVQSSRNKLTRNKTDATQSHPFLPSFSQNDLSIPAPLIGYSRYVILPVLTAPTPIRPRKCESASREIIVPLGIPGLASARAFSKAKNRARKTPGCVCTPPPTGKLCSRRNLPA